MKYLSMIIMALTIFKAYGQNVSGSYIEERSSDYQSSFLKEVNWEVSIKDSIMALHPTDIKADLPTLKMAKIGSHEDGPEIYKNSRGYATVFRDGGRIAAVILKLRFKELVFIPEV